MSKDLNKRLYSFCMFDGCITRMGGGHVMIVNMLEENQDYIDKVKETLDEVPVGYNESFPAIYTKDGFNRKQQIRLQAKSHPVFAKIYERMYINGHKVIDPHMLTLLDAEMLAIAFMADGSRYVDKRWENSKPKYRLHLNNLSYGDLMLFKNAVKEKLFLEINTVKKGAKYDVAIPTAQSERFEQIVESFILPSFQYKLGR